MAIIRYDKRGSIVMGDKELVCFLPNTWEAYLDPEIQTSKFMKVKTIEGNYIYFNLAIVTSIREVSEQEFNNWIARIELIKNAQERQKQEEINKTLFNLNNK